jgi:hypothetical protein
MMKKLVIGLGVFFLMLNVAYAGTAENCGCGLGSMVLKERDGLIFQASAAIINASFANQMFGITFGTLGCERPQNWVKNEQLDKFVAANMDNLAADIASGQGESLNALAEIIEVPSENRPKLFAALQNNFDEIYPSTQVEHRHVVEKIAKIVEQI